jgi:hypothetical protein
MPIWRLTSERSSGHAASTNAAAAAKTNALTADRAF